MAGTVRFPVGVYWVENHSRLGRVDKKERRMKGIIAVVLGTMGYIMIGVALAGMG